MVGAAEVEQLVRNRAAVGTTAAEVEGVLAVALAERAPALVEREALGCVVLDAHERALRDRDAARGPARRGRRPGAVLGRRRPCGASGAEQLEPQPCTGRRALALA